jgi:hypothetical protein
MINVNDYLLSEDSKPDWLCYPPALVELIRSGRFKSVPWHLSKVEAVRWDLAHLNKRLGRDLVTFAYRQDREDLACFEKGKGDAVMIIHDNTDPGWEDEGSYPSFADWLRAAEEEAASWVPMSEDDVSAMRKRFGFDE